MEQAEQFINNTTR